MRPLAAFACLILAMVTLFSCGGPSKKDCPAGSGKEECCTAFPDSRPCQGFDEATCGSFSFCTKILGNDYDPISGLGFGPHKYLGCQSNCGHLPGEEYVLACVHPADSNVCYLTPDTQDVPDGWVHEGDCEQCAGTPPCGRGWDTDVCHPGSGREECCCAFPDSMLCKGEEEHYCKLMDSCRPIYGRVWDPEAQAPKGPEVYLGCRTECEPDQPHGDPTCSHARHSDACYLADDALLPDAWSKDCSACATQGTP